MAIGIDFVIGGQDKAGPAMASVENGLGRLQTATNALNGATKGLMASMAPLLAVYAAVKTAMAAIGGIVEANAQFDNTAEAVKGLEVALKIQGAAVETESVRLQKYAEDMQNVTGINDLAVMSLMKEASLLGVTSDKLDDMTTAAIGLAEATGSEASTAMTQLRMATEGVFTSFNRTLPQLKHMATDEEKLAAVLDLAAKGFEAKATWSNKTAEAGAMAGNAIDKLKESVGAIIAPFRALLSTGIAALANALSTALTPAVKYAEEMLLNIGPTLEWLERTLVTLLGPAVRNISWLLENLGSILSWLGDHVKTAIDAIVEKFLWFQVIMGNLGIVWEMIASSIKLYLLQIAEDVMHTLTVVIPGYVVWFGENIINLFKDAFNGVLSVISNTTRMMGEILLELFTFVFQDMGEGSAALGERIGNILASGITRGFESSLTSLPEIAGRQLTEREKELAERIGEIGATLGDEFNGKMNAHMAGAGGIGGNIDTQIELALNKAKGPGNEEASTSKRKDGTFGVSINAMESRLLTRGPASTYEQRMMAATEKIGQILLRTGEWVKATKEELEEMNKQDPNKVRFVAVQ
jgi:hypothetical protein